MNSSHPLNKQQTLKKHKSMSKRSQLPKLKCALHAKNAGRGPITDVSVLSVSLPFKQSSLNAISLEKVIIPPAGWSQATAALSGFSATYVDGEIMCWA